MHILKATFNMSHIHHVFNIFRCICTLSLGSQQKLVELQKKRIQRYITKICRIFFASNQIILRQITQKQNCQNPLLTLFSTSNVNKSVLSTEIKKYAKNPKWSAKELISFKIQNWSISTTYVKNCKKHLISIQGLSKQ